MLSAEAVRFFVIINSFWLCIVTSNAQQISGHCNIISPIISAGSVSYTITCNNSSEYTNNSILDILRQIAEASRRDNENFDAFLKSMTTNSERTFNELVRSRSPKLLISNSSFNNSCEDCRELKFINMGGVISSIDDISIFELVDVYLDFGHRLTGNGALDCPFRRFSVYDQNWITLDFGKPNIRVYKPPITESQPIAAIDVINQIFAHEKFKNDVSNTYNDMRKVKNLPPVAKDLLLSCAKFEFRLGALFLLKTYQGSQFDQFFVFTYNTRGVTIIGDTIHLEQVPNILYKKDFDNYITKPYSEGERSRKIDERAMRVNYGSVAEFMIRNTLPGK